MIPRFILNVFRFTFHFSFLFLGTHPAVLSSYFWLFTKTSLLVGPYEMPGIKNLCTLPAVLPLWPQIHFFKKHFIGFFVPSNIMSTQRFQKHKYTLDFFVFFPFFILTSQSNKNYSCQSHFHFEMKNTLSIWQFLQLQLSFSPSKLIPELSWMWSNGKQRKTYDMKKMRENMTMCHSMQHGCLHY